MTKWLSGSTVVPVSTTAIYSYSVTAKNGFSGGGREGLTKW